MENRDQKILVMDGNQDNLTQLIALILEAFPTYSILSALDGRSGLELAAHEQPDVILLGTQVPGMDSCEVCRKLKADPKLRGIPVVFLAAKNASRESRKEALECGAEGFITRPIDESELTALIRAMVKIRFFNSQNPDDQKYPDTLTEEKARKLKIPDNELLRLFETVKGEQALNEAILESIPGYFYVYDENGKLIKWNKKHETITGFTAEEMSHMTLDKWFDQEEIKKVNAAVQDVFKKGYGEVEAQLILKNGNRLMTRSSGAPFTLDGKKYFAGVGIDITEQKRVEQQLKQNVKDLLESQRIAKLGTWRLDLKTNQVVWSEELYKMYGFDPALPIPSYTEHMKLFTPESWNRLSTSLEHTRTSGIPYELELETVTNDGSNGWMWVRGEAEYDSYGNIVTLWGAAQDITEYKKIEHEIKQSEEKFQLLFNKAPLGYQSLDFEGYFIDVNQQWLDTLGYRKEEVIGKWFGDFLCPEYVDAFRQRFPVFKSQGFIHSEFEMKHKDGQRLTIGFEGKIGYGADGAFKQTHCILQDITSQRMAEKALAESEERFRVAQELSPDGFTILHPMRDETGEIIDFTWVYENQAIARVNQTDPEKVIGKRLLDLLPSHRGTFVFEAYKLVAKTGKLQIIEEINVGDIISRPTWMRLAVVSMGEDIAILSQDISERKLAQETSKLNAIKFQSLFDEMSSGAAIYRVLNDGKYGRDYIIQDFNKAALKAEGKEKTEVLGRSLYDLRPNIDQYGLIPVFHKVWQSGEPADFPSKIYFDEKFSNWYENHVYKLSSGEIVAIFEDISEKKQAEENTRKQNELFASLLKLLPVGVFMVDAEVGKPLVANDMAKALLGRGILPDASEDNLSEVYKAYKRDTNQHYPTAEMPIILGMKGVSSHIEDMVVERPDGSKILLEVFGTPVLGKDGKPWASLVTFLDITERKKAENELIYLNYHDHLTGFYNRRFFEEVLKNLDTKQNLPISIIICDINGLKLINDSFGHDYGDQLI